MFRRLGLLVAAALLLALPVTACSTGKPAPARSPTVNAWDGCPRWASSTRAVTFGVGGAHNLLGLVIGTGRTGIVLGHQVDGDLCSWMPVAKKLADRGYRVLAFDFNGFGNSASTLSDIDQDVAAAAAFLRADGAASIVLMGASMGGTAVVAAAVTITPPVAGVIDLSGPLSFGNVGINGSDAAPRLTVPALYVAATGDLGAPGAAQSLYDATSPALRTIAIVPGADHGIALLIDGGSLQGWDPVNAFLSAHAAV